MGHIDRYCFGSITIDGVTYDSDVLALPDGACVGWQREAGHEVSPADLWELDCHPPLPAILVIGVGSAGCLQVSPEARAWLHERGIELREANTGEAATLYSALAGRGVRVAAALHLTC